MILSRAHLEHVQSQILGDDGSVGVSFEKQGNEADGSKMKQGRVLRDMIGFHFYRCI